MNASSEVAATAFDVGEGPRQHIMLVDDEPRMRSSLRRLLARPDRLLTEAANGHAAMSALLKGGVDLVLLNIGLPDVSGLDILRWLSEQKVDCSVIVVSGSVEMEAAICALRSGAIDFLRKPDDLDSLPDRVDKALQSRRLLHGRARMAAQVVQSEQLHRFLVDRSPNIVYTLDEHGRFVFVNPRVESLLGYERGAILGCHYAEIVHEDDIEVARYALAERRSDQRATSNVEVRLLCPPDGPAGGPRRHLVTTVSAIGLYDEPDPAAGTVGAVRRFKGSYGVVHDITERKRAEEIISFQAFMDPLTLLPNRRLFRDHLDLALAQAQRRGRMVGLIFIDLDRFKTVNDTYGHQQGDELLRAFAQRLRACVRAGDTVARLGGDEFTVLLPDLVQAEDATVITSKIGAALETPFQVAGRDLRASASVGVAVYPRDGVGAEQLLQHADIAMYRVKAGAGNGSQLFDQGRVGG